MKAAKHWNSHLWTKHIFQYKLLSSLHFPSLGLYGSESEHERSLRELTMENFGIPAEFVRNVEHAHAKFVTGQDELISDISKKKPESHYTHVCRFLSFFDLAVKGAEAQLNATLLSSLLMRALVDYGIYFRLGSDALIRETIVIHGSKQSYEPIAAPFTGWGTVALPVGVPLTRDVEIEILGFARRLVDRCIKRGLGIDDALNLEPLIKIDFELFKNFLIFVIGVHGFRTLSLTPHDLAIKQLHRAHDIDLQVLHRLDGLVAGSATVASRTGDFEPAVGYTIDRLERFLPAVAVAWEDGHLDPEERVLSQYGAYHILGINDAIGARYLRHRKNLDALMNVMETN